MDKNIRDTLPIAFASGEEVVARCEYLNANSRGFHQDASLVLTNKRLVHVMYEKRKHFEGHYLDEAPIEAIDSIDYSISKKRNKISIPALVIAFLCLVASVVGFILGSFEQTKDAVWIGVIGLLLCILIVFLAIILRKWSAEFEMKTFSHTFKFDHLGVSNEKAVEQQVAKEKKHRLVGPVLFMLFGDLLVGGGIAAVMLTMMPGKSENSNTVLFTVLIIALVLLFYVVNFAGIIAIRRNRRTKKMVLAVDGVGAGKSKIKVKINEPEIRAFVNQCGASLINLRAQQKGE